jgi:hypothetical protein
MTNSGKCFQSRDISGVCDVCGEPAGSMHLPTRPLGFYCELHCPVCSRDLNVIAIADRKSGVCVSVKVLERHSAGLLAS